MPQIYRYDLVVAKDAIDGNGHVNNVEYVRWMQDAAMHHADSIGCTLATNAAGATWVVRSHRIEYLKPAFSGEHISVRSGSATSGEAMTCSSVSGALSDTSRPVRVNPA